MGQKAHPYGLRLGYIKPWKGRWFARRDFSVSLHEDLSIRDYLKKKLGFAGISSVEIERSSGRVRVRIFTARPGVIIGRRGQEIDKIKEDLSAITKNEVFVDIKEVKNPHTDAQLIAENIAMQLQKRVSFRKAMKKSLQMAFAKGALGMKVKVKGRLGGSEIAREEGYREGKVPLNTLRADIDFGFAEAYTTYGLIGCKVWVYKGDIFIKREDAERRKLYEQNLQLDAEASNNAGGAGTQDKKPRKKKAKDAAKSDTVTAVQDAAAPASEAVNPEPIAEIKPEQPEA